MVVYLSIEGLDFILILVFIHFSYSSFNNHDRRTGRVGNQGRPLGRREAGAKRNERSE
jgi:hypothetical protein